MPRKKTWEEHKEDILKVHGDQYEYPENQVLDKGAHTKIKISCKDHGEFEQAIYSHKNGRGCPDCGIKVRSEKRSNFANEGSEAMCEDGITRVIIPHKKAKAKGLDMYFTGKPCKNGHISERYVSNWQCIDCSQEYSKQRYQENKEDIKQYRQENKEHRNEYMRNRYATDENFKTSEICRSLIKRTLKATSSTKSSQTYEALGYCNEELLKNISSKLLDVMSWDNYGEWHIDHVIPVSRYIQNGITDPAVINALDNLIPMWDTHNLEKSARTLEEYLDDNPDLYDTYGHFLKEEI